MSNQQNQTSVLDIVLKIILLIIVLLVLLIAFNMDVAVRYFTLLSHANSVKDFITIFCTMIMNLIKHSIA